MTFETFLSQIIVGSNVCYDGKAHVVLEIKNGTVVMMPHGSTVYHGSHTASVQVKCLTRFSFDERKLEIH